VSDPTYNPKPLDTSEIKITEEILMLTERLAENAHDVWARERKAAGWKFGLHRNDEHKEHPCLVPYQDLPESEKQYDRAAALETIKAVLALGSGKAADVVQTTIFKQTDVQEKFKRIIPHLKKQKLTIAELRRIWEEREAEVWVLNVDIYRRAVDAALRLGEAFMAFDMAVEGLGKFPGDLRLIQLQALALARTGATKRANEILGQLRTSGHVDEETLGILARTHKDFWLVSADPKEKAYHLKQSFELYADGYRRNRGYYTGINAASMGLLYGEKDLAQQWGHEVAHMCQTQLDRLDPESDERYWLEATLAEAALVAGDLAKAEQFYRHASEFGGQSSVTLSRTRGQARLLLEYSGRDPKMLDHCFKLPRIVVFSGHMFDAPSRKSPRFPAFLEQDVHEEMRRRMTAMEAQVGFASLACGGDLLFAETLLERGGEINIILPFRVEDFKKCSVDIIPGANWGRRFDAVMQNAATVTILNEYGSGNDGAAFEYCNQAIDGLSLLKGQFLGMDVIPLAIWDGNTGARGGTASFIDHWQKRSAQVEVIHLGEMLSRTLCKVELPAAEAAPKPAAPETSASAFQVFSIEQDVKAMMFADIVGFTKLTETQVPAFVEKFLGKAAKLIENLKNPPVHRNTWGDAIMCVFDHVSDAGTYAMNLRDLVRGTDWTQFGLPKELSIRIALHAGPVYGCLDPILNKRTYNGSHVNRAARIEPIAEEGQVFSSQAFAALSAAEGVTEFVCDYVGMKQLAKKFGAIPVFLVRRKV
jgi:class 3 adenylate cyclase